MGKKEGKGKQKDDHFSSINFIATSYKKMCFNKSKYILAR